MMKIDGTGAGLRLDFEKKGWIRPEKVCLTAENQRKLISLPRHFGRGNFITARS